MGLNYLVIEYLPHAMDGDKAHPVRVDGHYSDFADAKDIAEFWAGAPLHAESRIVVVEIQHEAKQPRHWKERSDD